MNNWTNLSDQGIECLEGMSHVHTSCIETFNTYCEIFRLTFDKPSGIHWCRYPVDAIYGNRRRVITKLFDGFCLMPDGDKRYIWITVRSFAMAAHTMVHGSFSDTCIQAETIPERMCPGWVCFFRHNMMSEWTTMISHRSLLRRWRQSSRNKLNKRRKENNNDENTIANDNYRVKMMKINIMSLELVVHSTMRSGYFLKRNNHFFVMFPLFNMFFRFLMRIGK